MAKGRNTSVISIRLSDEVVNRLKKMAKSRRISMTELVKPVIATYAFQRHYPRRVMLVDNSPDEESFTGDKPTEDLNWQNNEDEEPPDLEKYPDYWKDPEPKRVAKFPGTPRNAPCPCGALHPDGRPKKYKHCCGA